MLFSFPICVWGNYCRKLMKFIKKKEKKKNMYVLKCKISVCDKKKKKKILHHPTIQKYTQKPVLLVFFLKQNRSNTRKQAQEIEGYCSVCIDRK